MSIVEVRRRGGASGSSRQGHRGCRDPRRGQRLAIRPIERTRMGAPFLPRRSARRLPAVGVVDAAERVCARSRHSPESECMSSSEERSMNYLFTLEVSGIDTARENYEDALYEAGW